MAGYHDNACDSFEIVTTGALHLKTRKECSQKPEKIRFLPYSSISCILSMPWPINQKYKQHS